MSLNRWISVMFHCTLASLALFFLDHNGFAQSAIIGGLIGSSHVFGKHLA